MNHNLNLDEIAEQELLNEAKRGAARASQYGALGWQKCPLNRTNKVFLQNMLLNTVSSNNHKDKNSEKKKESTKRKSDDLCSQESDQYPRPFSDKKKSQGFISEVMSQRTIRKHSSDSLYKNIGSKVSRTLKPCCTRDMHEMTNSRTAGQKKQRGKSQDRHREMKK